MKADWSSSAAVPLEPVGGEHLVPVVADPAAGPAIPAAARQAHRVGVGRSEERLGRGGAPVDQQPTTRAVGEAEPSDVHGLGVVCADHVAEAQVQAEATQRAQAGGQPVDLHGPGPSPPGRCRRAPCARRRDGRTGRRSTARGSPRSPRSAARRRRSAPGRPWRARWSGRSNALVVRRFTSSAPIRSLGPDCGAHDPLAVPGPPRRAASLRPPWLHPCRSSRPRQSLENWCLWPGPS